MRLLDNLQAMERMDRLGMLERAEALPAECLAGWEAGRRWPLSKQLSQMKQVVTLGMGGSAIGADILQGILGDRLSRPLFVNRTYMLPEWVGRGSVVLACSYSGNTEETLSAARQARQRGANLLAITSGGELAAWAKRHRIPLLNIPRGLPPRSALGYMAFIPLGLFVRLGWARRSRLPVESACAALERYIRKELVPEVRTSANPAKRLALSLVGRLPVLYGPAGGWEGLTYRWRTQLEENSKTLAFHHIFPEATHNEISAWLQPKPLMKSLAAVFLTDPAAHPRTLRRMEFTRRIIRSQGARVLQVEADGRSLLERLLKLIALGEFASIYLAFLHREDPTPVVRVEALKRFMKK